MGCGDRDGGVGGYELGRGSVKCGLCLRFFVVECSGRCLHIHIYEQCENVLDLALAVHALK